MITKEIFETALDELEDFITILKVNEPDQFTYVYANKTALEKGNVTEKDYGKTIDEVLSPRRVEYLKKKYLEAISLRKRLLIDDVVKMRSGHILGDVTVTPVISENGKCTHIILVARNITEKKQKEEELRIMFERYQLIAQNMSDIIFLVNVDGKITFSSPTRDANIEHNFVYLVGKNIYDLVHNEDLEDLYDIIEKMKLTKKTEMLELRYVTGDNGVMWLEVHCTPVINKYEEISHFIVVARNVTRRKESERELEKSREKYSLIANNTSDLIKTFLPDETIIFASPSHEAVLGFTAESLEGQKVSERLFHEDIPLFHGAISRITETKNPELVRLRLDKIDGEWIEFESIITPIIDEHGIIQSFLSSARNITERLKNEELIRSLDRLSIIGQLAAGVAHEIRNPLTSLKGFSKILQSTIENTDQMRYLNIMMDELDRIDLIVNEFMSLAKPQAVQFKEENLNDLINSTITVLETQALLHNVQINYTCWDNVFIRCQPNQIKQVIMNFIKNAIEAMQSGGDIEISVKKEDLNNVKIQIIDEGPGIEEERLKFIGTPFYTTKEKGIGLGLTISNKIVQEHGGTMTITSKLGEGTTVDVILPYRY